MNTPNFTLDLPGMPYTGDEPEAFLPRNAIVNLLRRYAEVIDAPVHTGVDVTRLSTTKDGTFNLETSLGSMQGYLLSSSWRTAKDNSEDGRKVVSEGFGSWMRAGRDQKQSGSEANAKVDDSEVCLPITALLSRAPHGPCPSDNPATADCRLHGGKT